MLERETGEGARGQRERSSGGLFPFHSVDEYCLVVSIR